MAKRFSIYRRTAFGLTAVRSPFSSSALVASGDTEAKALENARAVLADPTNLVAVCLEN